MQEPTLSGPLLYVCDWAQPAHGRLPSCLEGWYVAQGAYFREPVKMVVLGDQYALLSLLWCDALGLGMEKTGVLVKPHELRRWLDACLSRSKRAPRRQGRPC